MVERWGGVERVSEREEEERESGEGGLRDRVGGDRGRNRERGRDGGEGT